MASVLKYLNVELRLATQDFNNGLKAAQREAKEFEKTIKPMKQVLHSVGVVAGAVGLAIVGSFTAMAKASANYGDALNDASKRTGATVEDLAKLKFAAEQSGASFDDVSTGMRFLAINSNAAAEGSKNQAKAFADLGIKVTDAAGKVRPMNDLLLDIADKFKGMEDGAEKSALAVELFGRGGTALIPTLNEGREGLKSMGDQAQRLGLVISKDAAEASDAFNDSMGELKGSLMGLSNAVGEALLPHLTSLVKTITEGMIVVRNFAREHEYLTKAVFALGAVLAGAGGLLVSITAATTAFTSMMTVFTALKPLAASVAAGFTAIGGALTVLSGVAIAGAIIQLGRMALAFRDLWNAQNSLIMAQAEATLSEQKAIKVLAEHGYHVKLAGLSTAERAKAIGAATQAMAAELRATQKAKDETKQHTSAVTTQTNAVKASSAALDTQADKLREVTRALQDQYTDMRRVEDAFQDDWDRILDSRSDAWLKGEKQRVEDTRRAAHDIAVIQSRENDALMDQMGDLVELSKQSGKVMTAETKKNASEFSRAWETAIGNITSRTSDAIADMIVDFKFSFKSLIDIAKETAKGLLSAFISGFISPLTSKLGQLGGSLFGGLFGGGGGAGAAIGGGGAGGIGGSIAGLATNPFTLAAAGALAAAVFVPRLFGGGRKAASKFTEGTQDQFGRDLASIVDPITAAEAAGTLTREQVASAQSRIAALWDDFRASADEFAKGGDNERKVVNQAFSTLTPIISQINADMARRLGASGSASGSGATITVAPIVNVTFNVAEMGNISAQQVRDDVMPSITDALETGIRGFREKWAQMFRDSVAGVASTKVA